jgi:hypothetical protein
MPALIEDVAVALRQKDYPLAAQLLEQLPANDPRVLLYQGQLAEEVERWTDAEQIYRQVLQSNSGPKLSTAAREGLLRLQTVQKQQRDQQRQQVRAQIHEQIRQTPETQAKGPGVLVLEPVQANDKTTLAQAFAKVMGIEPYAARLLLPSRGWRLYRSGQVPDLQVYGQELQAVGVPVFWAPLSQLNTIKVLQVSYFQAAAATVTVLCSSGESQREPEPFEFRWQEVQQRVEGQIPIFEQVLDRDRKGKMLRKEQVLDHIQFCDLHLPGRNTILRIYSGVYQFHKGLRLNPDSSGAKQDPLGASTTWANWQQLQQFLGQHLGQIPRWADYTSFADTALDHPDLLEQVPSQIRLFRREGESQWDQAYQLYSTLLFWRSQNR